MQNAGMANEVRKKYLLAEAEAEAEAELVLTEMVREKYDTTYLGTPTAGPEAGGSASC